MLNGTQNEYVVWVIVFCVVCYTFSWFAWALMVMEELSGLRDGAVCVCVHMCVGVGMWQCVYDKCWE